MDGDKEKWFASGCDDWLTKPMADPDLFDQMLERLIGTVATNGIGMRQDSRVLELAWPFLVAI